MKTKLKIPLWIFTAVAAIGAILATGNLLTLSGIESQMIELMPEAEVAVRKAVAISKKKSLIGLAACLPVLLICLAFIRSSRGRATPVEPY